MADKVTGTNKLLTYAAVADMIAVNHTVISYDGEIDTSVDAVTLTKLAGSFIDGKTINALMSFLILSVISDDRVGGGTLTGTLKQVYNGMPLYGVIFGDYSANDGCLANVKVTASNDFKTWRVPCKNNVLSEWVSIGYLELQFHVVYE